MVARDRGTMVEAFSYIIKNRGISSENAYPYHVKEGRCLSNVRPATLIRGFRNVPSNNERALLEAVSRQPISVGIDASGPGFIHYKGGVYNARDCGTSVNHAVTFVGYGTSREGIKYWLAKNSWGKTWGEKGYTLGFVEMWRVASRHVWCSSVCFLYGCVTNLVRLFILK